MGKQENHQTSLYHYLYGSKSEKSFERYIRTVFGIVCGNNIEVDISKLKGNEFLETTYSSIPEKERSEIAIRDNLTQFKEKDVTYRVNRLGIRTSGIDLVKDYVHTLMLGCSFTFGEGLPYKMTWPYLISKKYSCSFENLGFPGAAISRIARILTTILPIKKPKRVIVLFPSHGRQELFTTITTPLPGDNSSFDTINYSPGYPHSVSSYQKICLDYEQSLSSHIDLVDMYKNFHIIKLLADNLGIELIVSSWDHYVHEKLYDVFDESQIAAHFHYLAQDKKNDKARDGMHPGENPNRVFTANIEYLINGNKKNAL
jgi:hypothetical protein